MSAQYVFNLTVQLGCQLPVRDNLNKYVYSTTRIGNIWYMEPEPAQAEFVYAVLYRLALFLSEITVVLRSGFLLLFISPKKSEIGNVKSALEILSCTGP